MTPEVEVDASYAVVFPIMRVSMDLLGCASHNVFELLLHLEPRLLADPSC